MPFTFSKFLIEIKALEPLLLPTFKGSTFRGAFGATFRIIVCAVKKSDCSECILKEKCIYSYVFETPVPYESGHLFNLSYAPHPFVIEPPLMKENVIKPGISIHFGLVLIGKAIEYLPYFIYTFDEMGKQGIGRGRGKFKLGKVFSKGPRGGKTQIFYPDMGILKDRTYVFEEGFNDIIPDNPKNDTIKLNFLTPTRIKHNGSLTIDIDFQILVKNIFRRISLLSHLHCNDEPGFDYKTLIKEAGDIKTTVAKLEWYDWERYSMRQDRRMKLGGFVGEIEFKGNIEPFRKYIEVGEHVHIGKNTSFGLGKYEILR